MTPFTTYYQSVMGWLKISGTEQYITEILFVNAADVPTGQPATMPPLAIQTIEQLIQYFSGNRRTFDLPINQQGSAFQQKVWNELMNIPFGKTITYLELSRRLGDPKVIRAAASANGRNNVVIIVPCHRVVGTHDLGGYSAGLGRKKWLLNHENKVAYGVQTLF